jgi:cyclohexanone monooxygenase
MALHRSSRHSHSAAPFHIIADCAFAYVLTEKYAGQSEIQAYLKDLAQQSGVTPRALFTKAQTLTWGASCHRWIIKTDRGDEFRARFILLCAGSLSQPKLPTLDGIETFQGRMLLNMRRS